MVMSKRELKSKAAKLNVPLKGTAKTGKYGEMVIAQQKAAEKKRIATRGKRDKISPESEACCVIY